MWNVIKDNTELEHFMTLIGSFHDSCIKEMHYLSGAYVNDELSMYPINDRRKLRVIIQRQYFDMPIIEMEFLGLKYMKLFPVDENYTCEILDSTLIKTDDCIYWCDCGGVSETELNNYNGTIICASGLRWRSFDKYLGQGEVYLSILQGNK